jgi:hypothetical protein
MERHFWIVPPLADHDTRGIGERKRRVLRTAMPGHDE